MALQLLSVLDNTHSLDVISFSSGISACAASRRWRQGLRILVSMKPAQASGKRSFELLFALGFILFFCEETKRKPNGNQRETTGNHEFSRKPKGKRENTNFQGNQPKAGKHCAGFAQRHGLQCVHERFKLA